MDVYTFKLFLILPLVATLVADAQVLQCPSCTYVNTEADVPSTIRYVMDGIIDTFSEPKCKAMLSGPIPEIKMETCAPPTGRIAMCSYYEGSVNAKIDITITSFNVPLKMYQQGCYYALSANPPPVGCHDRKNINEDKSTLLKVLEKANSLVDEVVSFEGKRCVCRDSYCKDVSGASKFGALLPLLILAQFVAMLLLL